VEDRRVPIEPGLYKQEPVSKIKERKQIKKETHIT
jgi:hypothetical protein